MYDHSSKKPIPRSTQSARLSSAWARHSSLRPWRPSNHERPASAAASSVRCPVSRARRIASWKSACAAGQRSVIDSSRARRLSSRGSDADRGVLARRGDRTVDERAALLALAQEDRGDRGPGQHLRVVPEVSALEELDREPQVLRAVEPGKDASGAAYGRGVELRERPGAGVCEGGCCVGGLEHLRRRAGVQARVPGGREHQHGLVRLGPRGRRDEERVALHDGPAPGRDLPAQVLDARLRGEQRSLVEEDARPVRRSAQPRLLGRLVQERRTPARRRRPSRAARSKAMDATA